MLRKWAGIALVAMGVFCVLTVLALVLSDGITGTTVFLAVLTVVLFVAGSRLSKHGEKEVEKAQREVAVDAIRREGLEPDHPQGATFASMAGGLKPEIRERLRRMLVEGVIPATPSAAGVACADCAIEAPTRKVYLVRNTGMLVARKTLQVEGPLCAPCIRKHAKDFVLHNLFLGWWGTFSFLITAVAIPTNIYHWVASRSLAPPPEGAKPPLLEPADTARLQPLAGPLADALVKGHDPLQVCRAAAKRSGLTPGQVVLFVRSLAGTKEAV